MKVVQLKAKWDPKPDFKLGSKDVDGKLTYLGSQVWRYLVVKVIEKEKPQLSIVFSRLDFSVSPRE